MRHKSYHLTRLSRAMLAALLLALGLLPASAPLPGTEALSAPPAPPQEQQPAVDSLPLPVQYAFSSDLGRDDAAYHLEPDATGGYAASNRRAGLAATFRPSGMEVRTGADTWSLALSGWGRGAELRPVPTAGPAVADANRLEYAHGPLTEWYANGPLGLQQGWTLAQPPAGAEGAPLTLALTQGGTLRGRVDGEGSTELALVDAAGAARLRYGGLLAYDAAGRALPAWFEADGERVLVRVDDTGATYPVVVDPWLQASKLTTSHGADWDRLGYAVAVSEDGGTVVAGAPYHDPGGSDRGAVYVYTRPGTWATTPLYTARLTAGDGADGDKLGWSVAVSADGGTVVAGAPYHDAGGSNRGAAYVFVQPPGGWVDATETARLTAGGGADGDTLGHSVAVSGDGGTVVAGAPNNDAGGSYRGAAYVFVRPPGGWATTSTFTAKLTAAGGADYDYLGSSVAVSGDGGMVVAGAHFHDAGGSNRGAAYVFVRPAAGWGTTAAFAAKLTAADGADMDLLGSSVAVSDDGDTVVAGAKWNDVGGDNRGAAYIYVRSPGGWATTAAFTAKLTAGDGANGDGLGESVAVSDDGGTVVAGAIGSDAGGLNRGAAYVFVRPPGGWASAYQTAKLTAAAGGDGDFHGLSVALSADGGTVVAGAPYQDDGGDMRGAAYVYAQPPGGWATTTETAKLTAADGADGDFLGWSVALSGDGGTVVAGAQHDTLGGWARGPIYVYVPPPGGWATAAAFTAKLTAGDSSAEHFGSVAVSGDGGTVVAGAPSNDAGGSRRGAIYVYVRPPGGWATTAAFTAKLTAHDGVDYDRLGGSVALSADGDTVVAGAPYHAAGGLWRGAAYVYVRPPGGWATTSAFTAKLTAGDGADYDYLGRSVALSSDGDTVVAGAPRNAGGGLEGGAAYVYVRPPGGWASANQTAKLTAADRADGDWLGGSVVVSGDGSTVVAGAPGHAAGGSNRGAAYVYVRPSAGWETTSAFAAKLTAADGANGDKLGWSVAVSGDGDTVVTGVPYNAAGGRFRGAAYVYVRPPGGWATTSAFTAKPTAGDGADGDFLGWSVALSSDGGTVVAGAPHHDILTQGDYRGAAYVFTLLTPPQFTSGPPPSPAKADMPYGFTFAASGHPAPAFSVTEGALPPGLNLDGATGLLSGTPTRPGRYAFTVTASNGVPPDATVEVTIDVVVAVYLPLVLRGAGGLEGPRSP